MIVSKVLSQRKSLLKSHDLTRLDCNFLPSSAVKLVSLHCVPQDQLGSSPSATVAAMGLPLYRLRAERLRAFPSGSRGDFCLRSDDTPGKTMAIAERSATSTDFPPRAERYQKMLPVGIIL